MLRVYYSNETEELLRALVEALRAERSKARATLFDPVHLVVPNRNMETFVKLGIAKLEGICANFETRLLGDFLRETIGSSLTESSLFDRILAALFDEAVLARPELEPVRSYIFRAGDSADACDRRRVQLARKLARLLSEYQISRPELLECWRAGLLRGAPDFAAVESWQKRLWLEVVGDSDSEASSRKAVAPGTFHLFGVSYFPRAHALALGLLARGTDVSLYTLNPCQELWEATHVALPFRLEDAPRRYERRGRDLGPGEVFSLDNPFRLVNTGEMVPLRIWGKPGRESLRLLNALTGCELVPRMNAPDGTSLLHRVQRDIVLRKPERTAVPRSAEGVADESIVFLECGSVRRELEVIASEIWSLLSRDGGKDLRFNDIALILVPSVAERYQALVGSVFGEAHQIPYNIVDLPVAGESRLAEAIELLLALPLGGFTRTSVLRFVTHPTVLASFPDASPDDWVRWCDLLGIVRGSERRDLEGTYVDKDLLNWDQGLVRLALGQFLHGEPSGEGRLVRRNPSEVDGGSYLPEEVPREAVKSAGSFGVFLRSLIADAKAASRAQMTLSAWMDFVATFITTYLQPHSREDERVLRRCLRAMSSIAEMQLGGEKVRYRVVLELAGDAIAHLSGSRGQYLVDGVVVSSFLPMRAIPFRVVFIAGLGEGQFPASEENDHLDLRGAHHRAGDVGPRDRDRYLFLQTILSTRDRLYLSYVGRDELTGERLSPSSVVSELRDTLLKGYVAEEGLTIRRHLSPRWEDPRTRRAVREAAREKKAQALGEHLRVRLGVSHLPPLARIKRQLPLSVLEFLSLPPPPPPSPRPPSISLPLATLRAFLECPLQGSARFHLRLRDDSSSLDHDLDRENEPFQATAIDRHRLLVEAFLRGGGADAYDDVARRFESRGAAAIGIFGSSERRRNLEVLSAWQEGVRQLTNGTAPRVARNEGPASPPLVLTVGGTRVELLRSRSLRLEEPKALLRLASQDLDRFHPQKDSLKGFLDHVYSCAAGLSTGEPYLFLAINAPPRGEARTTAFRFAPVDREAAVSYLESLLADLFSGVHDYLLPCESVFSEISHVKLGRTSTAYGPVPHPEDYQPPDDETRAEIIRRRFGLYFEVLVPAGETS